MRSCKSVGHPLPLPFCFLFPLLGDSWDHHGRADFFFFLSWLGKKQLACWLSGLDFSLVNNIHLLLLSHDIAWTSDPRQMKAPKPLWSDT